MTEVVLASIVLAESREGELFEIVLEVIVVFNVFASDLSSFEGITAISAVLLSHALILLNLSSSFCSDVLIGISTLGSCETSEIAPFSFVVGESFIVVAHFGVISEFVEIVEILDFLLTMNLKIIIGLTK